MKAIISDIHSNFEALQAVLRDIDKHPVSEIYCRLLGACEQTVDVTRAEQWMAVMDRFVVWSHFVPPVCQMH